MEEESMLRKIENVENKRNFFTAPFNNMRTLKFKIQPTVTLFTAVNHYSEPLRKQKRFA